MIEFVDALVTLTDDDTHGADSIDLNGTGIDYTSADDNTVTLLYDGTSWYEVSRSTSTTSGASSTDNAIPRWDGTGGTTLQDSGILVDDSDNVTLAAGTIVQWSASTIISDAGTNGDFEITDATHTTYGGQIHIGDLTDSGQVTLDNDGGELEIGTSTSGSTPAAVAIGTLTGHSSFATVLYQITPASNSNFRLPGTGYISWGASAGVLGTALRLTGWVVDSVGADEERFICAGGSSSSTTTCNDDATFRMGDMDEDDSTTGRPAGVCDDALDGAVNMDEVRTLATSRFGRGMEACVEEWDGTSSSFAWRSVVDLYASEYMDTASGAISFTTAYAIIDDATSTYAIGDAVNGFSLTTASGVLSPEDDASGKYQVSWHVSFTGATNVAYWVSVTNDNNTGQEPQCEMRRDFGGSADYGSIGGTCIMTVNYAGDATDDIFLVMKSDEAGGANATISHAQLVLRRL
jgi:hypothetical protein